MTSNYDLLPTLLDYLELRDKTPQRPELPGRSYAAVIRGCAANESPRLGEPRVLRVRERPRRAHRRLEIRRAIPRRPARVPYDLRTPARQNLYGRPPRPKGSRLQKELHAFFDRYADPKYGLDPRRQVEVAAIVEAEAEERLTQRYAVEWRVCRLTRTWLSRR